MTAPEGCKTPAKDREEYMLTMADLKFMTRCADKIWKMLSYYSNMPENGTGELAIPGESETRYEAFEKLSNKIEDIKIELDNINLCG